MMMLLWVRIRGFTGLQLLLLVLLVVVAWYPCDSFHVFLPVSAVKRFSITSATEQLAKSSVNSMRLRMTKQYKSRSAPAPDRLSPASSKRAADTSRKEAAAEKRQKYKQFSRVDEVVRQQGIDTSLLRHSDIKEFYRHNAVKTGKSRLTTITSSRIAKSVVEKKTVKPGDMLPWTLEEMNALAPAVVIPNNTRNANFADIDESDDPVTAEYCEIGVIGKAHGVRGEIKAHMLGTDFASDRLRRNGTIYIRLRSTPNMTATRWPFPVRIARSKQHDHRKLYVVLFSGLTTRNQAELLRGSKLYARLDDRPELADNEYLIRDLIGFKCFLSEDNTTQVGNIDGIVPPSELCKSKPSLAQRIHGLIEMKMAKYHSFETGTKSSSKLNQASIADKYCLIPFVPAIVTNINMTTQSVYIDPPQGLLQLTYAKKRQRAVIKAQATSLVRSSAFKLAEKEVHREAPVNNRRVLNRKSVR
jgi:16S rRNA processing protein RimM